MQELSNRYVATVNQNPISTLVQSTKDYLQLMRELTQAGEELGSYLFDHYYPNPLGQMVFIPADDHQI